MCACVCACVCVGGYAFRRYEAGVFGDGRVAFVRALGSRMELLGLKKIVKLIASRWSGQLRLSVYYLIMGQLAVGGQAGWAGQNTSHHKPQGALARFLWNCQFLVR